MDRYRSIMASFAGVEIPRFVVFLLWIVFFVLVIILLAWIVHRAGGGTFVLKLGHFSMQVGVN